MDQTRRNGILAGGNFITDYVKIVESWPEQDTLTSIRSESMCNGGGPYNILKDLVRLAPEIPVSACGLVGKDLNGQWILDDCQQAGIETSQLSQTSRASTSYTDAMTVESTGRRTFFHQRGTNALLAPEHFDFSLTNAKIFMLGYLMLLDTLDEIDEAGETGAEKVLRSARAAGLVTAVDCVSTPSPEFRQVVLAAIKYADILFLNEFEIGQVIGKQVESSQAAMAMAVSELAEISEALGTIVLHAPMGAVAWSKGNVLVQPAVDFPNEQIVGSSGAGDAFAAGFLVGIHQGLPIGRCLEQAVCSAAQSLTDATPSDGLVSLADCANLAQEFGFRDFE